MDMTRMVDEPVALFKQMLLGLCSKHESQAFSADSLTSFTSGLSEAIREAALATLRAYLLQHDTEESGIVRDGILLRNKGKKPKVLMTPFGVLPFKRAVFQADHGGHTVVPLDEACGIRGMSATREVRDAMLFAAAHNTPEEVEQMMAKMALFNPSATAIKNAIADAGTVLEEQFETLMDHAQARLNTSCEDVRAMVVSLDGANVLLNEPGKKKGRPAERPGIESSEHSTYRNAMVGSFSMYGAVPEGRDCPERLSASYVGQMPEDKFPTFKAKIIAELERMAKHLPPGTTRVLLCDGQRSLWTFADSVDAFAGFERLLDFHHATEHLSLAAEAIFGKGTDTAKAWYDNWRIKMLEQDDAIDGILRSMLRYRKTRMSKDRRKQLASQITYFKSNQHMMRYAEFRKKGLPIGSGPVEAACKTLVKHRLCRSGMRWSRTGGQHVLAIRAIIKSGRWEQLWPILTQAQEAAHAA